MPIYDRSNDFIHISNIDIMKRRIATIILRFLIKQVQEAAIRNSFAKRLVQAFMIRGIDNYFLDDRVNYLNELVDFDPYINYLPRVVSKSNHLDRINPKFDLRRFHDPEPEGAPFKPTNILAVDIKLTRVTMPKDTYPYYDARIANELRSIPPIYLFAKTQGFLSDVYDPIVYGMIIGTICSEWGSMNGRMGEITPTRLFAKVKDSYNTTSYGIYQINSSNLIERKHPWNAFYLQTKKWLSLAQGMIRSAASGHLYSDMKNDPEFIQTLYRQQDLVGFLARFRRIYHGVDKFESDELKAKIMPKIGAFPFIVLSIAEAYPLLYHLYDPELPSL